jgi:xanthine/uracil/vitamin C permease (AzgA family)
VNQRQPASSAAASRRFSPAVSTALAMPLAVSIANGTACGFITYDGRNRIVGAAGAARLGALALPFCSS